MKSNRVLGMAIILLGVANLVLIITRPVNRVLSWCFALPGVALFILANIMYAKERGKRIDSVYADWDKGFDEEQKPIGAYGKSFHALKIKEMLIKSREKCPRCAGPLWRKEGLGYLDKFGNMVQLWKCLSCKYEEERFIE